MVGSKRISRTTVREPIESIWAAACRGLLVVGAISTNVSALLACQLQ
jgi:hypothetical protein